MRRFLLALSCVIAVGAATVWLPCGVSAQDQPAAGASSKPVQDHIPCGPASWVKPQCPVCREGGKTYVEIRFVEGEISKARENLGKLADPKPMVQAMTSLLGLTLAGRKRWQEEGEGNPEKSDTYCWKAVKAEDIKPMKDNGYTFGEGTIYEDHCLLSRGLQSCLRLKVECRKQRDASDWLCMEELRWADPGPDGSCESAPMPECACQPSKYYTCGLGQGNASPAKGSATKARGKRR